MHPPRVVADALDDAIEVRRLLAAGRASATALVVTPTPGRGGEGIGRDLLRAMGKRFDAPRTPRDPEMLLGCADVWLRARGIHTVVIRHAHRLPPGSWERLAQMGPVYTALWLLVDPAETSAAHDRAAAAAGAQPASIAQLHTLLDRAPGQAPSPPHALASRPASSTAPDIDYPFFAEACGQPGHESLLAHLQVGCAHASWLRRHAGEWPSAAAINRMLAAAAHGAPCPESAIARTRGAQLQLLNLFSIHTRINARRLRIRVAANALSPPDQRAAELLDSYVDPLPAAAAAACLSTGRGPTWLSRLTHADRASDHLGGYPIPIVMRPFLALLDGGPTHADGPLLTRKGSAVSPTGMRALLDGAARRTQLRLNLAGGYEDPEPTWVRVNRLQTWS